MKLSIKEILESSRGEIIAEGNLSGKFSISTDTRTITENDIFLPLKGPNFDGHDYIKNAISKGCKGYLSADDTLLAYLRIANYARRKINPHIVAITGSSGKTTTKEYISSVLSTSFITHKSALNHNNEIGLCQTLLSMPESCEYVVIEMGMRGPGEIELLSKYAEPDIAIITNVGTAHIGRLGSVKNIAKAKCEITSHLKKDGVLIAFEDDLIKNHCDFPGRKVFYGKEYKIISQQENLTEFEYKGEYYEIPASGIFNVYNAIAAIETGILAGISYEKIREGLLNYAPVGERGKVIDLGNNIKIVADCYNANPESVKASIDAVIETYENSGITLVIGDMAELGEYEEQMHREIGRFISGKPIKSLITVGEKAKFIADAADKHIDKKSFLTNAEASEFLKNNLESNSVVLLKASRCMKFEEIINSLT